MVLIAAGFDAAEGDPLGGMCLTPSGYHHMTRRLVGLAEACSASRVSAFSAFAVLSCARVLSRGGARLSTFSLVSPRAYLPGSVAAQGGRVCAVMEGGYSLSALADCAEATLRGLLGEAPPPLGRRASRPRRSTEDALRAVADAQRAHWPSLRRPEYEARWEGGSDCHGAAAAPPAAPACLPV